VDKAAKGAVDNRRDWKRNAKADAPGERPPGEVAVDGVAIPVTDAALAQCRAKRDAMLQQRGKLVADMDGGNLIDLETVARTVADLEDQMEANAAALNGAKCATDKAIRDARGKVHDAAAAAAKAEAAASGAQAGLEAIDGLIRNVTSGGKCVATDAIPCPLAGTAADLDEIRQGATSAKDAAAKAAKAARKAVDAARADADALADKAKAKADLQAARVALDAKVRDAQAELELADPERLAKLEAGIDALDGRTAKCDEVAKLLTAALDAQRQYDAKAQGQTQAAVMVETWDAITKALEPGGAVHQAATEAAGSAIDFDRMAKLAAGLPVTLSIAADWTIRLNSRDVALASEGQRMLAALVIADAFAQASGLRLLIVDRLTTLDSLLQGTVLELLDAVAADYDTVLVCLTAKTGKPQAVPKPGWRVFWIDEGTVEIVN